MNLVLTIVQCPPGGAAVSRSFESAALGKRPITLGRQPDNDWVLPNDTSVSRRHCQIVYDQSGFALIDSSSFGSVVNERRVGRGQRAPLHEGDRIVLGEYAFTVSLDGDESPFAVRPASPERPSPERPSPERPSPERPSPERQVIPEMAADFAELESPFQVSPSPSPFQDSPSPFPESPAPFSEPAHDPLDPFANAASIFDSPQARSEPDEVTYPDDISFEKDAFALPNVRNVLPDDADILGDLRPVAPAAPVRPSPMPAGEGLAEFLKGAGLNRIAGSDSHARLKIAGETFRAAIDGIREILAAREQFKTELRVDKTQFGAARNNPLKSKVPLDDAVAAMLFPREGFTPGPEAMREALEDIKAHEMALIAGIQVALSSLLEQIDPERLERRLEKRSIFDGLPGLRKARLWEVYETTHAEIARELAEDFQGAFGKAFAEAYAKYSRRK